jgi:hypothetical protein
MNKVWYVNVVLIEKTANPQVFHIVAGNDQEARGAAIVLANQNWHNLYGRARMPFVDYCEVWLEICLSEDVYNADSVDGG